MFNSTPKATAILIGSSFFGVEGHWVWIRVQKNHGDPEYFVGKIFFAKTIH
ncbi:hypothetical protein [Paenibacillus barcinonensis]|uniref:hypothetical protein n=1 Tax=Paenibacillus barcinonensis TaxID=198119 RepID=UPI001ABFF2E0|nr:hypothetical protein [Paenibacillus barcinonensis]